MNGDDRIDETPRRHGTQNVTSVSTRLRPDTEMYMALPYTYDGFAGPTRIPYVAHLGDLSIHADRAELLRLRDLIDRALAAPAPEQCKTEDVPVTADA